MLSVFTESYFKLGTKVQCFTSADSFSNISGEQSLLYTALSNIFSATGHLSLGKLLIFQVYPLSKTDSPENQVYCNKYDDNIIGSYSL